MIIDEKTILDEVLVMNVIHALENSALTFEQIQAATQLGSDATARTLSRLFRSKLIQVQRWDNGAVVYVSVPEVAVKL